MSNTETLTRATYYSPRFVSLHGAAPGTVDEANEALDLHLPVIFSTREKAEAAAWEALAEYEAALTAKCGMPYGLENAVADLCGVVVSEVTV